MNNEISADRASDAPASFADYRSTVASVSHDLHRLHEHATSLDRAAGAAQLEAALMRLHGDKFSVAVVGEFKRGKSTFINALLRAEVLPTDVLPCSATINRVMYGLQKRAIIEYKDGRKQEIPFEGLSDHITKLTDESEEHARSVARAIVYYPSVYCQNNVEVLDTPGLNDQESMETVTLGVLHEVDAAILVISALQPFSEYERKFLETHLLSAHLGRVLFVVNRIDQLSPPTAAERALSGIEDRLRQNVLERAQRQFGERSPEYERYVSKLGKLRVFGLSAQLALDGRLNDDADDISRSRFEDFEQALQRFLLERRGVIALQVPINQLLSTAQELLSALRARNNANSLEAAEFERAASESEAEVEALRELKQEGLAQLERSREQLRTRATVLADEFVADFRRVVESTIDGADIPDAAISGPEARKQFDQRLSQAISTATTTVVDRHSARLQAEVEAAMTRAVQRLESFDLAITGLMVRIAQRFDGVSDQVDSDTRGGGGETTAFVIAALLQLPGVASGYRSAGWKGAGVGAAANIGVAFAGGLAAAVVGAPITLPVLAIIGVASFFSSRWVSDAVFRGARIENYRAKLRAAALARVEQELASSHVREHFQRTAAEALTVLWQRVEANAEAVLQDATTTLVRLRHEHDAGRIRTAATIAAAEDMQRDIEAIYARAEHLSQQLTKLPESI